MAVMLWDEKPYYQNIQKEGEMSLVAFRVLTLEDQLEGTTLISETLKVTVRRNLE